MARLTLTIQWPDGTRSSASIQASARNNTAPVHYSGAPLGRTFDPCDPNTLTQLMRNLAREAGGTLTETVEGTWLVGAVILPP